MKHFFILGAAMLTVLSSAMEIPKVPFQYSYEIVSNSRSAKDVTELYYYKEKIIDAYESYIMPLGYEKIEEAVKNNLQLFCFQEDARCSYINGTIVVLLGNAKGVEMKGQLRKNTCDGTVIREKIFILELFS